MNCISALLKMVKLRVTIKWKHDAFHSIQSNSYTTDAINIGYQSIAIIQCSALFIVLGCCWKGFFGIILIAHRPQNSFLWYLYRQKRLNETKKIHRKKDKWNKTEPIQQSVQIKFLKERDKKSISIHYYAINNEFYTSYEFYILCGLHCLMMIQCATHATNSAIEIQCSSTVRIILGTVKHGPCSNNNQCRWHTHTQQKISANTNVYTFSAWIIHNEYIRIEINPFSSTTSIAVLHQLMCQCYNHCILHLNYTQRTCTEKKQPFD